MQRAPGRSSVAAVTSLLVALSACVAMLAEPAGATTRSTQTSSTRSASAARPQPSGRTTPAPSPRERRAQARRVHDRQVRAQRALRARRAHDRQVQARRAHDRQVQARRVHDRQVRAQQARIRQAAAARRAAREAARRAAKAAAAQHARWLARWAKVRPGNPRTWITFAPDSFTPPPGPKFNDPYASKAQQRALLTLVIRAINSSPGYRLPRDRRTHRLLPCPTDPRFYPSQIRIATYSIADKAFADAVVAAHRRCVSVQVLMNSHLTSVTSHPWGRILRALGKRGTNYRAKRSFARRCTNGCLGTSVLHSKIYLFSRAGRARDTVITGSSNMTRNAVGVQWNDLFTVNDDRRLYSQFTTMFVRMVPDRMARGPYYFRDGPYQATFYPFRRATRRTDATMRALRSVRCSGAAPGSGIHGHTLVYIAMHAWFGQRGGYLADQVRSMYRRGCYVRILYSFMSYRNFAVLTAGAGHRMTVRRVMFPGRLGLHAVKYSHMKMFAVSGNVEGNRSARVVWTGSNNWTDRSDHADEVTLRIVSRPVYQAYVRHWKAMRHRRATRYWALFAEPQGGGRAP